MAEGGNDEVSGTKSEDDGPGNIPAPRDAMIATARAFLQNPKVKDYPFVQKRLFLLKKGLTIGEIDIAMGVTGPPKDNYLPHGSGAIQPYAQMTSVGPPQQLQPSLWIRWRELCTSAMVVGATCYGCYYLYRRYVEPLIIGRVKEEEDRMTKIERHLQELNKSLSQLRHSLVSVESTLSRSQPQEAVTNATSELGNVVQDSLSLAEIKSDLATVKSLLLSRKQFPATPSGIPSWQLKSPPDGTENDDGQTEVVPVTECMNGEQA